MLRLLQRLLCVLLALMTGGRAIAAATPGQGIVIQNFRIAREPYPPPYERQHKLVLEGAKAQPDGKKYNLTEARLWTYRVTGEAEMEITTPECVFDSEAKTVSSSAALKVQTMDGKFSISGVGFLWRSETNSAMALTDSSGSPTNFHLTISNSVHTVVAGELLSTSEAGKAPGKRSPPIEIRADRFEYSAPFGLGTYSGNVVVTGTNLDLRSDRLQLVVPGMAGGRFLAARVGGTNAVQTKTKTDPNLTLKSLEAVGNIRLHYTDVYATGERAIYEADTGVVQVFGQPAWTWEEMAGHADQITYYRPNGLLVSDGNAFLRMTSRNAGMLGFSQLADAAASSKPMGTNQAVEVSCGRYEVTTNRAFFITNVVANQVIDQTNAARLASQRLTLNFVRTNELKSLLAEQEVSLSQGMQGFTAGRLAYDVADSVVKFTQNPTWRIDDFSGSGDVITVNTNESSMTVEGKARMLFPVKQFALGRTNRLSSRAASTPVAAEAEVTAEKYRLTPENALFDGGVHLRHPQMDITAGQVNMQLVPGTKALHRLVAERQVNFVLSDADGQKTKGSGDRAIYTQQMSAVKTNGILELVGQPATVDAANRGHMANRVLILEFDEKGEPTNLEVPSGDYRISATNVIENLKGRLR
jgi:lipopolysaccharide export system protein LptA